MKKCMPLKAMGIAVLLCTVLISCKKNNDDPPAVQQKTFKEKLQKALDDAVNTHQGKGISLAVLLPDGTIEKCASGRSQANVRINTDMLFSAGSITKMFTAATVLQYVEEGKLNLEDSIHQWFPNYTNIDSTISIRQLLNHTCGIYEITESDAFWQEIFTQPSAILDKEEVIIQYTEAPYFEKGNGWTYCNTAYLMLRILIEDISGKTVAEEYRSRLINPNKLTNTYTAIYESLPSNTAYGWFDMDGDNVYDELPPEYLKSFYSAAGGGIFCTAEDLTKWAKSLFINKGVLGQEMMQQMLDMHSPCGEDMVQSYGLGVYKFNPDLFHGFNLLGHGGDPIGYAAGCFYMQDYDVCIGIMDNTEEGELMWVINDVLELVKEHLD